MLAFDDEELIRAIAGGQPAALATLYDRYARSCYGLALHMVGSLEPAEQVVREAFWQVWRGAPSFSPGSSRPGSWLLSLVHHQAVEYLSRQRGRSEEPYGPAGADDRDDRALQGKREADLGEPPWRREQRHLVEAALTDLPSPEREAIELAYFSGLSQSVIAERQQAPVSVVKTRLRAGLQNLSEALQHRRSHRAHE